MRIIYSDMEIPQRIPYNRIFLAGPTPRDAKTPSWRPEALRILKRYKYNGLVFYPEWSSRPDKVDYDAQVEWEHTGLTRALWVVFWVPRELKRMPAFTTNVEFGRFAEDSRALYGRPDAAPKNRYLDWWYSKCHPDRKIYNNLKDLLKQVL